MINSLGKTRAKRRGRPHAPPVLVAWVLVALGAAAVFVLPVRAESDPPNPKQRVLTAQVSGPSQRSEKSEDARAKAGPRPLIITPVEQKPKITQPKTSVSGTSKNSGSDSAGKVGAGGSSATPTPHDIAAAGKDGQQGVTLLPLSEKFTGGSMAGIAPTCEDRDDKDYKKLFHGRPIEFPASARDAKSFCFMQRRIYQQRVVEKCKVVPVPIDNMVFHFVTPDLFDAFEPCAQRRKLVLTFLVKKPGGSAKVAAQEVIKNSGGVKVGEHEVDAEGKASLMARALVDEQGEKAIVFARGNVYQVVSAKIVSEVPVAEITIEETFVRLGDLKVRLETSSQTLERNCNVSLDVPPQRRIDPKAWGEALKDTLPGDVVTGDRKRLKLFAPERSVPSAAQPRLAFLVDIKFRHLLASTQAAEGLPPIRLTSEGDNILCPSSTLQGSGGEITRRDLEFGIRRTVRDAGLVLVGVVSLDMVLRDSKALTPAHRSRALDLIGEAFERIQTELQGHRTVDHTFFVQRQDHPRDTSGNRMLSFGANRTHEVELLATLVKGNAPLVSIPLRQIKPRVMELLSANELSPESPNVAVVLAGLVTSRETACAQIRDIVASQELQSWFAGAGRLLVLEFAPNDQFNSKNMPAYRPVQPEAPELLHCPSGESRVRVEVLAVRLPGSLLPDVRDNVLEKIVETSRNLFAKPWGGTQ